MVPLRCSGRRSATPAYFGQGRAEEGRRRSTAGPPLCHEKRGKEKRRRRRTDGATLRVRGRQGVVVVDLSCWPYGQEPPPTSWVRVTASSSRPRRALPPFGGLRLPPPLASAGRRRAQVWTRPLGKKKRPRTVLQGRSQTSPFLLTTGWTLPRRRNLSFPASLRRPGVGRPRGGGGGGKF